MQLATCSSSAPRRRPTLRATAAFCRTSGSRVSVRSPSGSARRPQTRGSTFGFCTARRRARTFCPGATSPPSSCPDSTGRSRTTASPGSCPARRTRSRWRRSPSWDTPGSFSSTERCVVVFVYGRGMGSKLITLHRIFLCAKNLSLHYRSLQQILLADMLLNEFHATDREQVVRSYMRTHFTQALTQSTHRDSLAHVSSVVL